MESDYAKDAREAAVEFKEASDQLLKATARLNRAKNNLAHVEAQFRRMNDCNCKNNPVVSHTSNGVTVTTASGCGCMCHELYEMCSMIKLELRERRAKMDQQRADEDNQIRAVTLG